MPIFEVSPAVAVSAPVYDAPESAPVYDAPESAPVYVPDTIPAVVMTYDRAVAHVRGLVYSIVRRCCPPEHADHADLVQEGFLGVMAAADSWREGEGSNFATWAHFNIRGRVLRELTRLQLRGTVGSVDAVTHTGRRRSGGRPPVFSSLDEPRGDGDSTLHDLIGVDASQEIALGTAQQRAWLLDVASSISDRHRAIVAATVAGEELTLAQLGERFGVTGERIRQIVVQVAELASRRAHGCAKNPLTNS